MNRLRTAVMAAVFTAAGALGAAAYDADITISLNGLTAEGFETVAFDGVRPVQIDGYTYVPARALAEAAGMTVEWDQSSQTALITLAADEYSQKPVERYAAELINQIGGYGLELEPVNITAALTLGEKNAVIRYNFADSDGDIVAIGKSVEMNSEAKLIDNSSLVIPLRNSMEMFGLDVNWNQETLTAEVSVPEYIIIPQGLKIIANHVSAVSAQEHSSVENTSENAELGEYIGTFEITHYCPCEICNGGWGAHTAWAGEIVPGQTIAVDSSIIGKLRWVYIEGYGLRRAEDCGGGVQGYRIDVAVATHEEALSKGVVYRDVYYVN